MTLRQVHNLYFELHATNLELGQARLWGKLYHTTVLGNHSFDLQPTLMPPDLYRVSLGTLQAAPEEGWVTSQVGLEINAQHLGFRPLAFYVGEPTDWASGIVRFAQPYVPSGPGRAYLGWDPKERPGQLVQGPMFVLSVRRES